PFRPADDLGDPHWGWRCGRSRLRAQERRRRSRHAVRRPEPELASTAGRAALVLGRRLHPGRPHQLFALGFRRQTRRALRWHDQKHAGFDPEPTKRDYRRWAAKTTALDCEGSAYDRLGRAV